MTTNFSIIVPAFNEEKTINLTLSSILKGIKGQEKYYEIIIIDSLSTDDTCQKAKECLNKENIQYEIIKLNQVAYPGKARNIGVRKAKYNQLIFIDCGVTITKTFFEECQQKIIKNDVIWFQSSFIFNTYQQRGYVRPYFIKREKGRYIRHSAMKKKVLISLGYFKEDLRAAEDWLFYKQIEKEKFKEYFSNITGYYQGYPDSLSLFFKKWQMYFEHSVYANLYKKNLLISLIQLLFILVTLIGIWIITSLFIFSLGGSIIVYLLARSGYSFYKSKLPPTSLSDMIYTIITSELFEISRVFGVLKGIKKRKI